MRTLPCLVMLAAISSCSAPEPPPALSESDRVVFRGFAFAFDHLVERNWQAPVCAAIEHDRPTAGYRLHRQRDERRSVHSSGYLAQRSVGKRIRVSPPARRYGVED